MTSGPMSSTRSSRSTTLPSRLTADLRAVVASETICPSRTSSSAGSMTERLDAASCDGDLAVVVGAPDVDERSKPRTRTCRGGRRCRRQVGSRVAVGLLDQPACPCRRRTRSTVSQVAPSASKTMAPLTEVGERGVHGPLSSRASSRRPHVEVDVNHLHLELGRSRGLLGSPMPGPRRSASATVVGHLGGPVGHVPDRVAALGHRPRPRLRARSDSASRRICPPRVVDVVLAVHVGAAPLEQRADRVAVRRVPAVADVDRAGGVGRDELDHDLRRRPSVSRRA